MTERPYTRCDRGMRNEDQARLAKLATAQHGVFHLSQADGVGVSRRKLRYAEQTGGLESVHPKVWRMPGSPRSVHQAVWGAVLQVGNGTIDSRVVASHECSLRLRGIERVPFVLAVSTGTGGNQHHFGVRVHRFCDLSPDMIERIDGIPVTTVARAIVDLTSVFRRDRLDQLIDQLTIVERATTFGAVNRALRRSNRRGRTNIRMLQQLLDARDESTPMSMTEKLADELLVTTDLPKPEHEYPLPGWELGDAFVDRAWPDAMLIVEIDGRSWHGRERDMQRDRERDRNAGRAGWYTARFIHSEVRDEPDVFLTDVVELHRRRSEQLSPPPT